MSKLIAIIAASASLAVASVALSTNAKAGEVLDRVLQTQTLTVAIGTDWGKMASLDDQHQLAGSDVDVAEAIAKYLGVKVKFVTPGWDIIAAGKWQGRWDLAMGEMTMTKAAAEQFDFPGLYAYSWTGAFVHKDSKATKLSDLDGKVIGVASGTTADDYINHKLELVGVEPTYKFKPGEVKTYQSTNVAFDDLRLGDGVRLDAVLGTGEIGENAIKAGYPLKGLGAVVNFPCSVAILHGDKEFSDKIAEAV
ncbi:transporter substrate-binding domain-containing protein, partial [Mesorhizobium sp. M1076]|uniref:transporter substrate-binding domain-containing protein n=1 Tax=Mesorhizobium sp. M1076 TaxID=2957054 RepID=UPI003336F00D